MIFILNEDDVLHVANTDAELQGEFEGVDVEDGIYRFFDECGRPLAAEFIEQNQRGKILGPVQWIRSGRYRLRPCKALAAPQLSALLSTVVAVHPNPYLPDIEAVRLSLACRLHD